MPANYSRFDHPAAWKVTDLPGGELSGLELSAAERDALLEAVDSTRHIALEELDAKSFDLSAIATQVQGWVHEVRAGRGIVRLRNLPVEDLSVEACERLFFGLGTHLGVAVSQSNDGEKVGHVVNLGGQDRRRRAYQNARQLQLHTDRCDHVGMLCLRPAASGGLSGYASALTIHNVLLEEAPELLEPLYTGFRLHRFGEQTGDSPLTDQPVPIYSVSEGQPNIVYIRGYIDLAVDEGLYELTPLQQRALDTFDEIANRPDVRLDLQLERGEATLTNNSLLLHRRTGFEDAPDPALRRHLLRLWLMDPNLPAVPAVQAHKSLKGIEKVEGRGTYYQGPGFQSTGSNTAY